MLNLKATLILSSILAALVFLPPVALADCQWSWPCRCRVPSWECAWGDDTACGSSLLCVRDNGFCLGTDKAGLNKNQCSKVATKGEVTEFVVTWSNDQSELLNQIAEEAPQVVPFLLSGMPLEMPEDPNRHYQVQYSSSLAIGPAHAKRMLRRLPPEKIHYDPNSDQVVAFADRLRAVATTLDSVELTSGHVETRARVGKLMDGNLVVSFASQISTSEHASQKSDSGMQSNKAETLPVGPEVRLFLRPAESNEFSFAQASLEKALPVYAVEDISIRKRTTAKSGAQ